MLELLDIDRRELISCDSSTGVLKIGNQVIAVCVRGSQTVLFRW